VELRFTIYGPLGGVVFTDWGNVWRETYTYRLDDLRYSAGAGVRFKTPVGKIRMDFARPIFDDSRTWQFHLSIGPAF
jgi:outer membrane protein insertion porin family